MANFEESYPKIQSYEKFKELINKRGFVLLQEKEPAYCQRFHACETLGLKPRQIMKECNPLLSGKFNRFIDLLESVNEVGYYWKRLTEMARLVEVKAPETPHQQMHEASWFIYNIDYYFHIVYGLQERTIKFLTIFRRMYKSPSPEEAKLLELYTEVTKTVEKKGAKLVRHPLVHERSQAVDGLRDAHEWEASLLRNDTSIFIEAYDKHYLQEKEFYLKYIRTWVPQYGETLSIMFDRLCAFSLERLEL